MEGSFLRGLSAFLTLHSFSVTCFALDSHLFLIQLQINTQRAIEDGQKNGGTGEELAGNTVDKYWRNVLGPPSTLMQALLPGEFDVFLVCARSFICLGILQF
jgi:hypothetical protein